MSRSPLGLIGAGVAAVALAIVGLFLSYQIAYSQRIFPGVRVLGTDIGGQTYDEARSTLRKKVDELSNRQLVVGFADQYWSLTAHELGLRSEIEPLIASAFSIGHDGSVMERFSAQFGLLREGRSFEQTGAAYDRDALTDVLNRMAQLIDRPVQEAQLTVRSDFSVDLQPAITGRKVDLDSSRRRVQDALDSPTAGRTELIVQETAPKNPDNNLDRARDQASRILAAPITLRLDERVWRLERVQLASILRFDNKRDAAEAAFLDRNALENWAKSLAKVVDQTPQDARFAWADGKLDVIRPSKDGLTLDVKATVDAIVQEAQGEHQDISLPITIEKPAVPMAAPQELGIKELIQSSRTPFAGATEAKQDNITLASRRLQGVVIPPGGTFSFNKELGSTSLDAGYKLGWGISTAGTGVKTVPSVAGGICQVATTLFHSVFWSGFPIEERYIHLYWIPSYTSKGVVGLDATVDEEAGLDFQFKNPTKNHLLIQSWIDNSLNVNFALYGTRPDWTVKVDPSVMTDIVKAEIDTVVTEEEQTMPLGARLQVERATDGFVVTTVRHVIQAGDDRVLRLVSHYRPSRNVVLVGTGGKPPSKEPLVETNKPATALGTPAPGATPTTEPSPVGTPAPQVRPVVTGTSVPAPVVPTVAPTRRPPSTTGGNGAVATPNRPPVTTATPSRP